MLKKLKQPKAEGFTIIEVMIVLAIAGLILLIVFLAVPALQRSSRNTQRKNDVAQSAAGVANYIANNAGNIPDAIVLNGGNATISCTNGGWNSSTCIKNSPNTETAKVGLFSGITVDKAATATDTAVDANTLLYVPGWNCNSSNTGLGAASARTAAFMYKVETGSSSTADECTEQ